MASNAYANRYLTDGAGVIPQPRLLVMLYDRVVLDLEQAESGIPNSEWDLVNQKLLHAQAIILELHSALDLEAWEGAKGLSSLYSWIDTELTYANVRKDVRHIRPALKMLRELRNAWHEAYNSILSDQAAAAAAPATAVGTVPA